MNRTSYVKAENLIRVCKDILSSSGVPTEDAQFVAETLVEADLRGINSHGILRLGRYVRELNSGVTNPNPEIKLVDDSIATAKVDGDGGLGPLVGKFAMETCIKKAKEAGSATVTAFRSRHFGAAGYYARMAQKVDLIGISMTVASPRLAPTGGKLPLFGNNPIALSVPGDQSFPLVIDFASGKIAAGRLELAASKGEKIPADVARDLDGKETTDPDIALKGTIVPIAEHKGYALTLFIEILAGLLGGAPYFGIDRSKVDSHMRDRGIGHFFMVIDPCRFMPLSEFKMAISNMIEIIKHSPKMPNTEEILLPGEIEFRNRESALKNGIPLADETIEQIRKWAQECGTTL
jgi:LDH2 family malate/lactate/ureidoglycolate dehydrogenase